MKLDSKFANASFNKLYEATLKELKSNALPKVKGRVRSQSLFIKYLGVDKKGIIHFQCTSGTTPGKFHYQQIKLLDLEEAIKMKKTDNLKDRDVVNLALFGDIAVYCSDESFQYYWSYQAWVQGYGLKKETRYPKVRNPKLKGSVCKHLVAVLNALPMYLSTIQKDLKKRKLL